MKVFNERKIEFISANLYADELYSLSIGNLVRNAKIEEIQKVGQALGILIEGFTIFANIVETYTVSL